MLLPHPRWSKSTMRYAFGSKNRRCDGSVPTPGPAVKEHHRLAVRIAALLEVELVHVRHAQTARAIRLDGGIGDATLGLHQRGFFGPRGSRRARRPAFSASSIFGRLSTPSVNRPLVAWASATFTLSRVISMKRGCAAHERRARAWAARARSCRRCEAPRLHVVGELDLRGSRCRRARSAGPRRGPSTSTRRWKLRGIQSALADEDLVLAAVGEVEHAAVLEEAVDERAHLDGLAHAAARPGAGSRCRARAA